MPKVYFIKSGVKRQMYGSSNEQMVADITIKVDGKTYECELRQDGGERHNFDETELNISVPEDLKSKVQYEPLRAAAQRYYRMNAVGKNAKGFKMGEAQNIQLVGLTIAQDNDYVVDVPPPSNDSNGGW